LGQWGWRPPGPPIARSATVAGYEEGRGREEETGGRGGERKVRREGKAGTGEDRFGRATA